MAHIFLFRLEEGKRPPRMIEMDLNRVPCVGEIVACSHDLAHAARWEGERDDDDGQPKFYRVLKVLHVHEGFSTSVCQAEVYAVLDEDGWTPPKGLNERGL